MQRRILFLLLLIFALPAYASRGITGGAGIFFVLASIPVAIIGLLVTSVLAAFYLFRKPLFFWAYAGFFIAVPALVIAYILVFYAPNAFDKESVSVILKGESALLVLILFPAFVQYWRRYIRSGPPIDHRETEVGNRDIHS